MPTTGQTATQSGVYAAACCRYEIALSKGETFPPCRNLHYGVTWTLVRPTFR